MIRSIRAVALFGGLAALCLLIATPAQATHVRPKGAWPSRLALVPAYPQCTSPDRSHGPPLGFPSCSAPAQESGQATVGTPDAFGGAANSSSYVRLNVGVGTPGPPDDSDVRIDMHIDDIRCVPSGGSCGTANASGPADYSGNVRFEIPIRLTDHNNGVAPGGGPDTATVEDISITYPPGISCAQTASTGIGSTCGFSTYLRALIPGIPKDFKREVWELGDLRIDDGGADGDTSTSEDNTVFLRPGVFIP